MYQTFRRVRVLAFSAMLAVAVAGCGSSNSNVVDSTAVSSSSAVAPTMPTEPTPAIARVVTETVSGRPFEIDVPAGYDASTPVPLVVVLHGYTGSGAGAKAYFQLAAEARKRRFLTVYPDGTKDSSGNRFWNGTDACCQLTSSVADDSAYLTALIDRVAEKFSVDPKRIFLAGHSNGGFMSYRMACEHADRIAAIVSVAGATFDDVSACQTSAPVSVLQVHGTSDTVISFTGGSIFSNSYPGAATSVATWASYNGCASTPKPGGAAKELDLDEKVAGKDASVTAFAGCKPGGAVELWTIDGGSHEPTLTTEFAAKIADFFLAHPKP